MKKCIVCVLISAAAVSGQVEPKAGGWKTWVISSGASQRLPAPADRNGTLSEVAWLKDFTRQRDAAATQVAYWDAGSPSYRWVALADRYVETQPMSNPRNTRFLAILNVAVYDAMIAAWDTKYAYNRPRPSQFDSSVIPIVAVPRSPSYPSEHAVAAGAASAVLGFFYPKDSQYFNDLAEEAGQSRLAAGVQYPSDVIAGLDLGRRVAKIVLDYAATDGSDAVWKGTVPSGPGLWNGTNPAEPLAGTWRTWVLTNNAQFRPGPPIAYNSPEKTAELAEIKGYQRDFNRSAGAFYWQSFEGIFTYWDNIAHQRIFEYHLDTNPPRAARIYALTSVAHHDALIAGWEAKYEYWAIRPFQLDPAVTTLFATPNHPSYPAAHGFVSAAIARTLAYLFPNEAQFIDGKADEACESRIAAGIHYRSDCTAGLKLGRDVAGTIADRARTDGADLVTRP